MGSLTPRPSFWRAKRVMVTGHTGFKGSWLTLWLRDLGADVLGYSLDVPTVPSFYELTGVSADAVSVQGDLGDAELLADTVDGFAPDVVFHLAAQPLVRESYRDPVETYRTNVLGTVHLLDAVRRTPSARVVVNITSDKCYANSGADRPFREDDRLGGADPYSSSKAAAELVTGAYRSSFFGSGTPALASVRAGNVIGGGDWGDERLVPDAVRALAAGKPLVVRNPDAVRPWQHVLDCLHGYLLLAERMWDEPGFARPWNFGPDPEDARPVRWIADRLSTLWGDRFEWRVEPSAEPYEEAAILLLDSHAARSELGWEPLHRVDEALELTARLYDAATRGEDVRGVALAQVRAHG